MDDYNEREKNYEAFGFVPSDDTGHNASPSSEQQTFIQEEDGTTYRYKTNEIYPVPTNRVRKTVSNKNKKPKTWLVATVSAIVGALIFSVVSPAVTSLMKTASGEKFAFQQSSQSKEITTPIAYNAEGRQVLSTIDIGKTVGPCVVGVLSEMQARGFFSTQTTTGSGSGVIFTSEGHIITNYHVIEGASSVKVVLNTGDEYEATLVGADERTDLAVIKINASNLSVAVLGDSSNVEAGEKVVAIGNPLGQEFAGSLTQGIISAVNRTVTISGKSYNMLQTDAAINPGNSGGALVNEYGEVIGINSIKVASSEVEGLGFAIPISDAKPIIEDLMNYGYVKGRPLVGVSTRYVSQQEAYYYNLPSAGLFIVEVTAGTGADKAGLVKGDIIISCDGQQIDSNTALNDIRDKHVAGDTITLKINRNGNVLDVPVVLGEDTPNKAQ